MKNRIAIYFSLLAMMLVAASCSNDDAENITSPYAYISSFSVGDIKSAYPAFTAAGKDTTIIRTISGSSFQFTIDQSAGEIYNCDSMQFKTNVSKVVLNMTVEGIATIYNKATGSWDYFTAADSLDFTSPRIVRITSTDGTYFKDYTISLNVHQVEPEMMVWNRVSNPILLNPKKAIEYNEGIYVFGTLAPDNTPVFQKSESAANVSWGRFEHLELPKSTDFSTLHVYGGVLYVVAGGDLYSSNDAINWSPVLQGKNLLAIIGASDANGYLWVANAESIFRSADGVSFDPVSVLPNGFPLYGLSTSSYALSHNKNIIRYMVVGYTDEELKTAPKVWSLLSNESKWVEYANVNNPYPCPSLAGITVLHYDNFLYAFGGKGAVGETAVEAFNSFYVSKDNGIAWKAPESFYQLLPKVLNGKDKLSYAAFVDSDNYMWIITDDADAGVLKGRINRLGFEK